MHHIQKSYRAKSYRKASYSFILAYVLLMITVGYTIFTFFKSSDNNLMILGSLLGTTLFFWALAMIASGSCRCQLCQTSNMRSLRCSRHRNSKKLLGSHRLRTSTSIIFKGSFRCTYCGEPFSLSPKPIRNVEQAPKDRNIARTRPVRQIPSPKG